MNSESENCINSLKVEPGSDSEMCRDGNQVIDKRVEEVRDTTVEENPMMKTFPVIKAEDENCMDFVKTELGSSSETCPDENHFITVKVEVADIQEEVEEDQMLTTFSVSKDEDVRMSASMANKMFMSPDFVTKFLEEYRELPVLWKVRSADYSNRAKRDKAWDLLVQFTREKIPDADLQFVKKKVDSIRASFRKELRRVRDSKRSGASEDEVYKPKLWYFDMLLFTVDQENPRKRRSNLDVEAEDVDDGGLESTALTATEDEATQGEVSDEGERTSEMVLQLPLQKRTKTSTKTSTAVNAADEQHQNIIKKAMGVLNQQDDEYDTLGKTYAAKLRRMPAAQRDIADKLINDVLFNGLMNHLTTCTSISDYGYTSGDRMSTTLSSVSTNYSNSTPSPIPRHSNYQVQSPEQ
ncbi:uncharacterized protein LOC110834627 [Zootermopsis nevadensis]|uniref:MADF domain-containing protein n=1 Tax=Zootermopsis nevadensis TaxID=136037 RepID=A0A067QW41_ZOONE|nr:uncharacterized protein LOC110834627 [Zootermopsis nevadensis]XP_021929699.1 uncharacterized protein LOC110834627 [Zootermopsis nevadensis]XP_021929700.1 uncharacterized protein LOC110834627 [Zootermopsis nevadensis]KDR14294.1 hypothetical protein L798_11885 [Zootermopsis nevadensis]